MIIIEAKKEDAQQIVELIYEVEQSGLMLFEPFERPKNVNGMKNRIEMVAKEDNSNIFLAELDNKLVGYLFAFGGQSKRVKHVAYLVVGVSSEARGIGVGSRLFESLNEWANRQRLKRLELTVMKHNEVAINLYKKNGFEIEGTKKHSLFVDGEFVDEYYMSKILK
ncbi:GNAT family N-acetyltransferase [Bacillus alkalisoli]|uniref:GNAT family N-acetyltransferase n=1 Tax=Bacillus alkalisoli TaxID=2011008 RepID=UPI000C2431ED|nr:GNAT family N-acetyltransferase [Bacillus alkalisoli]